MKTNQASTIPALETKDAQQIIKYPLSTEKAIRLMEAENKLVFVVDKAATKTQVRDAIQEVFNVKVIGVQTLISHKGKKHAYIKLAEDNPAIDIATNLGLM